MEVVVIYKIAIVEDEENVIEQLKTMLKKYWKENSIKDEYLIESFSSAEDYLNQENKHEYDLFFLDIQMAGLSGMQLAREIRKADENVLIVFVTNMVQFAVESYEVQAYDFIVKPLTYSNFYMRLKRILRRLSHWSDDAFISISTRSVQRRLRILDIIYVEVINHNIIFHLTGNEKITINSTMHEWEKKLEPYHFVRCNSCYLINLRYVSALKGEYIIINEEELHISRSKKQNFLSEFAKYVGGSK